MMIRLADRNDVPMVMAFINSHWREGHILGCDTEMFLYQHGNEDGTLNFLVAEDKPGEMVGMLGWIQANHKKRPDVWTTMWKALPNKSNPMLGIEMLDQLGQVGLGTVSSVGINQKTVGIYHRLGYSTGVLNHFFLVNPTLSTFTILQFQSRPEVKAAAAKSSLTLRIVRNAEECLELEILSKPEHLPVKDYGYFLHRYFRHPIYQYRLWSVEDTHGPLGILVGREVRVGESKALRIVDFFGREETIADATTELLNLVVETGWEYVDFLNYGYRPEILVAGGWNLLDPSSDKVIVPNYFEPFLQQNIPIRFFTSAKEDQTFLAFKADGDQDRPSWRNS